MEKHWSMIWHQAMTRSFLNGKAFGKDKTIVFNLKSPASGEQLRFRFSNRFGKDPYEVGAMKVYADRQSAEITLNGKKCFQILPGGVTVDHLHPNAKGGKKLADAYDLNRLVGKEN